jgi:hypothetical protein
VSTGGGGPPGPAEVGGCLAVDRGIDAAGGDEADLDAGQLARLDLKCAGQPVHRPLRRDVRAHVRGGDLAEQRADQDQPAAALGTEGPQRRPGDIRSTGEGGRDDPVEDCRRHLVETPVRHHGDRVHDRVDPAETLGPGGEQHVHCRGIGHVGRHYQGVRARGAALSFRGEEALLRPRGEHHPVAAPRAPERGRPSDAAGRAGDHDHPTTHGVSSTLTQESCFFWNSW